MRNKSYIALLILGFGASIISCGSDETESAHTNEGNSAEVENPVTEPQDTVEPVAQVKWHEGEEPTDLEKLQLLSEFSSGKKNFDFYAVFTEPFWAFYFFGNEVMFHAADFEVPEVWPLEYPFTDDEAEQALSFMRNGEFWQLKVTKEVGSDGMSNIDYPYSVKLDLLEGGGNTELMKGE